VPGYRPTTRVRTVPWVHIGPFELAGLSVSDQIKRKIG
jgi:hypothetical protein